METVRMNMAFRHCLQEHAGWLRTDDPAGGLESKPDIAQNSVHAGIWDGLKLEGNLLLVHNYSIVV